MAALRLTRSCGVASLAVAFALPLSVACRAPQVAPPPDAEQWAVTGALRSNACAPGLDPIDPLTFGAEIRRDGSLAYWRIGEQPWVPGTLDRDGRFHFTVRSEVEIYPPSRGTDPELDPGTPGCNVTMIETIDGTMSAPSALGDAASANDAGATEAGAPDGGGAAETFSASNRIELVPVAGSDCRRALTSAGGPFPTLPCAAEYALAGARL
jgi:hypothetical protein